MPCKQLAKGVRVAVNVTLEQLGVRRELLVTQPRTPHVSGLARLGQRKRR